MGSLTSDFPALPLDADPDRVSLYAKVYADLVAQGIALPAQASNIITRAQLLAHLQAVAGAIIKAELDNDPEARGYGGAADDDSRAILLRSEFAPNVASRWPGASALGYSVVASTTAGLQATIAGGGAPGFDALLNNPLTGTFPTVYLRFRNTTPTVALRGKFVRIDSVPAADQLAFAVQAPGAPPAGNIFDIGFIRPTTLPPRIALLLRGIPYCPNLLDAADIASAKV